MASSRKRAWLRDELILALDLYLREGRNPTAAGAQDVSELLRAIPIETELASGPAFRNPAAVRLKVSNFVSLDPAASTVGMTRGGRGDLATWQEFAGDPARLSAVAGAIRTTVIAAQSERWEPWDDDGFSEAPEGALLTRLHRTRERDRRLVDVRKARALSERGALLCDICGFDYETAYGERGAGFIECHHTRALSTLAPNTRTRLDELALVCANCHRIIHRRAPWLSVPEVRMLLACTQTASSSSWTGAPP